jgi:putative OPT family oligopeptide transporter
MGSSPLTKPSFKSFVPTTETRPELTARAMILGSIFGVLFGAVTVYVGLRAGLSVGASIPISVLSISMLRAFGRSSILENNIVQSIGNAGQSIAAGVIFTLPALIFLGFDLEASRIFALALLGGWLGVLFMIPLRRQLIVEEHDTLTYPEGTACADVLVAGERGGSIASRVFFGLGMGSLYTLFQNENLFALWPSEPDYQPDIGFQHLLKGSAIRADCTPEYLGIGYIIGPRVAAIMLAGGAFSWLFLMPAIYFFGSHLTSPLYPGTVLVRDMSPSDLWRTYIRQVGAGAVAASGLITLLRTAPTILAALAQGLRSSGNKRGVSKISRSRTDHDLPPAVVFVGSLLLVLLMFLFLQFKPVPGAQVGALANLAGAVLVVVFGFLFVVVSARIVGIVGSSSNPVSGMTIATLMATTVTFLVKGWTAPAFGALAITIGGVVCIAITNAGDTAQDLKTGYLIGATPWKQQVAIMVGVMVSVFSIGATLNAMNKGLEQFQRLQKPVAVSLDRLPDGVKNQGQFARDRITLTDHQGENRTKEEMDGGRQYVLLNAIGSTSLDDGNYLYNPATSRIEVQWIQGVGSERAAAPQSRLMATVINGILSRKLAWTLVLLGAALVIVVELLGIRSLTFALGTYLSIATTLAIFAGGVIRWMVDRTRAKSGSASNDASESEISPGSLYASGLIAAGGIVGLLGVCVRLLEGLSEQRGGHWQLFRFNEHNPLHHDWFGVVMFALLAYSLYSFARKPLKS